jgi:acetolactate synthase-1/2/3 large subunit
VKKVKASTAIVNFLEKEGVKTIFGYPGGAVLPIFESLSQSSINHVLVRHEQGAIHAASGYALSSDNTGVCIATSGPGATNLITGIANAYMDSIPVVIITGQVATNIIGYDSFQEADIIGASEPFTKHNYLVRDVSTLGEVFKNAFHIANSGRKGPVLIDIPINIQNADFKGDYPKSVDISGYKPTIQGNPYQIKLAHEKIINSKRPLLCIGSGILLGHSRKELEAFVDTTDIPVLHTLKGKGAFDESRKEYVGMIGSHGHHYSNEIIKNSDLLIVIGMSISTRTRANFSIADKNVIHIDIDPAEVGKKIQTSIPIVGDAKEILSELIHMKYETDFSQWHQFIAAEKEKNNNYLGKEAFITNKLKIISDQLSEDAIIVADVGNNQISAAHNLKMNGKRRFITSGGLGTMGFSLPASIGAQMSKKDRQILVVIGDGGFQMVMNELITIYENDLNVKILLIDNQSLGMVRDLQKAWYNHTFSVNFKANPDFQKICEANYISYFDLNKEENISKFLTHPKVALGRINLVGEGNE